jgi:hypothetical protein
MTVLEVGLILVGTPLLARFFRWRWITLLLPLQVASGVASYVSLRSKRRHMLRLHGRSPIESVADPEGRAVPPPTSEWEWLRHSMRVHTGGSQDEYGRLFPLAISPGLLVRIGIIGVCSFLVWDSVVQAPRSLVLGGAVVTWVSVSGLAMFLQGIAASGRPGV